MEKLQHEETEWSMREENVRRTEEMAKKIFPNEEWENAASLQFIHSGEDFELPPGIVGIMVAKSRLTGLKNDESVLTKEIRQGKILADIGLSIYLLPKLKAPDGRFIKGPDAIINGTLYEFKTITGTIRKVEKHFRKSRYQCENVYLKIDNIKISKRDIESKIKAILRDVNYDKRINGDLIIYLAKTKETFFLRIKDMT